MSGSILVLNAGSSSLKFALFDAQGARRTLAGKLAEIESDAPHFSADDGSHEDWEADDPETLIDRLLARIETRLDGPLGAVGHRVVHGGREFSAPVRIDPDVLDRIDALTPLAPLHQPASVRPMRRIAAERPDLLQVACFDTAFHHGLEPPASRYPLSQAIEDLGVRRYGFHGLSYEAIAATLRAGDDGADCEKLVVAHLGNGASLCAMAGLKSIDTTMGFTALDGIMMGTRPGSLDPGILLYLVQQHGYDAKRLEHLLYHESGLLGVSGISSDIQDIEASDAPAARDALTLFAFRIAKETAGLAVSLGGIDRFVFTGGIGEHSPLVRGMVVDRLKWLGWGIDDAANASDARDIAAKGSSIRIQVIPTDEEGVIARHVAAIDRSVGTQATGRVVEST